MYQNFCASIAKLAILVIIIDTVTCIKSDKFEKVQLISKTNEFISSLIKNNWKHCSVCIISSKYGEQEELDNSFLQNTSSAIIPIQIITPNVNNSRKNRLKSHKYFNHDCDMTTTKPCVKKE